MKKLTAVVLVLVLVLSLCACGGKGSFEGKYVLKEISSGEMDTETFESILALAGMKLSDMSIEIKADGTAVASLFGEEETSKWEEKDGKYYIDGMEVGFSGNKITYEVDGEKMIFEK